MKTLNEMHEKVVVWGAILFIALGLLTPLACRSTGVDLPQGARLLHAVSGGLASAADVEADADAAKLLREYADTASRLAALVETAGSAQEGDILLFAKRAQEFVRSEIESTSGTTRARLEAVYATLGALAAYYDVPEPDPRPSK